MTIHQDIDKLFQKGLADYSENPPGFVWNNIERNLNKKRFKKRRNILYSIAASVALLLSFGAGFMFTGIQSDENVALNQNNEKAPIELIEGVTNETIAPKETIEIESEINSNKQAEVNKNTEPIIVPEEVIEQEAPSQKEEPVKEPNSNVKRVNSSGTLLPPMFASAEEFSSETPKFEEAQSLERKEEIEKPILNMEMKNLSSNGISNSRELNYDSRQLESGADYTLVVPQEKNYNAWSVGVSAAPLYSYRDIASVSSESVKSADVNSNYDQDYTNEKPLLSYSAGVNVNYKVAKRWRIQSGLYFSEMGQVSENVTMYQQNRNAVTSDSYYAINTSTGNINVQGTPNEIISKISDGKSIVNEGMYEAPLTNLDSENASTGVQTDLVQTYEFYEFPLVVNYTLIDRKLSMNVNGGLSANVLYESSAYVENDGDKYELDAESENLKNMNYSGILGFGIEYPIISRLKFNLQPTFRYSLSSINVSGSVYPYSFGIYSGLRYSF